MADATAAKLASVRELLARYIDSLDKCRPCEYYYYRKMLREFVTETASGVNQTDN